MSLIGFCGPIGAGKTTAARHLVEAYGFTRVRFAEPLKAALKAMGLSEREVDGDLKEVSSVFLCGRTPRHAMQTLGTEWGRDLIGADFWLNAWRAEAVKHDRVVVDDLRFSNEAELVASLGGIIVKIERPNSIDASSGHASEGNTIVADAALVNCGTIKDLCAQVDAVALAYASAYG